MNTTATRAHAHLSTSSDVLSTLRPALSTLDASLSTDREAACLPLLTDEQALATWERMKAVRKAYVAAIYREIPA